MGIASLDYTATMQTSIPVPRSSASACLSWPPEPFVPRRGLRGPHRQTLAGAFLPRRFALPPAEERVFAVQGEVCVLCHCHWQADPHAALTLVIVHGLEGSSRSHYVLGTADKAWAAGMNVVRMNVRNCGGTEQLGPTLYHSGLSDDVGALVRELVRRDGLARIALVGFSMGGNQVLKLAGELAGAAPPQLRAVAVVSPGIDLMACSHALHEWRNRLYEWNFLWSLRRTLRRKARAFPQACAPDGTRWHRSIRDFDNSVTAPHFGFASADDYYTRASASPLLPRIAVPTLIIHSADDPFILMTPETRARILANPNLHFVETPTGGHCAFVAEPRGYDGFWAERQAVGFLRQF